MKKWMFVFVLTTLMAFPGFSLAEGEQKDRKIVSTMDEVVVTATKTEEKRKDIPNSLILMDEMDIEESSATSLGELLANELGIDWRTYGNYGGASQEIHIRGMSGNGTQVLVNGVSVNSPSLGTADVSRIPLNNIERIEIVKGSGSLLYGSGAMGGTINIITKRPEREKMDLKVRAGYGSDNTYEASAEQGMFLSDDFGYYLTATRRETDGFRGNADLRHNDVSLKLVFDKGDLLDISLYGDYIDRYYGVPGVEPPKGTADFYVGGTKYYDGDSASLRNKGRDKDGHVVLEVKSQPAKWLGLSLRGNYTDMENYFYQRFPWAGWPSLQRGEGSKSWTLNEVLGAEGNVEIKPFDNASLLVGAEYKDYDWKNTTYNLASTGIKVPNSRITAKENLHTSGTFAEAQYRPCRYFKGLVGIRHEDHSVFGTENLPRFGVVINPLKDTALKFSTGKHFSAPTPNDLFWPNDGFVKGNPDLKPEKGWHTDVTLEQTFFDEKLFFTLSYFHWDLDDKILWGPDSNGVWEPENLKKYKADGCEVGTKIGPFYGLTLGFNYTYLDAEETNKAFTRQDYVTPVITYDWVKRRATLTPEHQFKGDLTYWTDFGLTITATARYMSNRDWYRTEGVTGWPTYYTKTVKYTLDSYWTADLKVQQRLYDHWILSIQGSNLFDKEYDTYFATFTDQTTGVTNVASFPGAGRSVFFSATFEY